MLEKNQFNIETRIALLEEWNKLRDFRLNLLDSEKGNSYVATSRQIREIKRRTDEQWKDILFGKDKFSVLALNDSRVVGMGRAEKKKDVWYLYNLGVKNEFRRIRIGAKLTATRLNEIKVQGGKEVRAFISKRNMPSFRIAESFGFKKSKTPIGWLINLMILEDVNNPITKKRIEEILNER